MIKTKSFKVFIIVIIALGLISIAAITFLNRPQKEKPVSTSSIQTESDESSQTVSIVVPDIETPSSNEEKQESSEVSSNTSNTADLCVDGDVSSKQTSSKPTSSKPTEKPKPKPPASSTPSSKPTSSKPTPPPPPVSSEPESSEPLIDPPYNPDGPQHGETMISDYTGKTVYFHVGIDYYIDEMFWINYRFGEHPEATEDDFDNNKTKFLKDGDVLNAHMVWCAKCKNEVGKAFWDDGRHHKALHSK